MLSIRRCVCLGLFVAAAGLSAVPAQAQGSATGIAGVVVSKQSGQAVPDATVTVDGGGATATTNGAGRFRLNAPTGDVILVVKAPGFLDLRTAGIAVRAGEIAQITVDLNPTPNYMERVQVTATKAPLSSATSPRRPTSSTRQRLTAAAIRRSSRPSPTCPAPIVSTQLGVFESVMLRGMPRGDPEFTNTLLLVDGVPQTTSRNGSRVVGLTINDASNIEIVRGPNSALYGRTAIGGSVNVRTADPTATPELNIDLAGGQFGTGKGVAKASGPISQWGGYYFSIGKERTGGYYNTKTGGDYVDGNVSGFGKLTFSPDSKSFGSVSFNRVDSDNSTPTNEPISDGKFLHEIDPRFDRLTNFNIPGPNYHQDENRFTVNYQRQFSPWARLVEVFGYRNVDQKFIDDGDFIGAPFDLAAHTIEMYPFDQELKENIAYQELRVELTPKVGPGQHQELARSSAALTSAPAGR